MTSKWWGYLAIICAAQPVYHQLVHAPAAKQKTGNPGQFDGQRVTSPQPDKKCAQIKTNRGLNQKSRIAITLNMMHGPRWPKRATAQRGIKLLEIEDGMATVVGIKKVTRRGQGRDGQ